MRNGGSVVTTVVVAVVSEKAAVLLPEEHETLYPSSFCRLKALTLAPVG